jgi:hypothetical protein
LSSSVQDSEGGGDGNGGDSCADPCQEFKQNIAIKWHKNCIFFLNGPKPIQAGH